MTRTSPSELVWNDKGSGAKQDGSFWTVPRNQLTNGWKMLGETCCEQSNSVNTPCSSTVLVREKSGENIISKSTLGQSDITDSYNLPFLFAIGVTVVGIIVVSVVISK